MSRIPFVPLACLILSWAGMVRAADISIPLRDPYNLFTAGEDVSLQATLKGFPEGKSEISAVVTDYFKKEVLHTRIPVEITGGKTVAVTVDMGKLPLGYYELTLQGQGAARTASLGVVKYVERTAEDWQSGRYRFGMKIGGAARNFDYTKAMDICARLGMVWTRHKFNDVPPELAALPIHIIYKIEMYPPEAYDEKRYGPIKDFKLGKFDWKKATIPMEEPYKKWLKEEIAKLPKNHDVFEIWNEPWGKVPPEDFAKVAQWTKDVVLEQRPNAKVGPNLGTHFEYDTEFIAKGGMEGMNALFLHPYGHPERSLYRAKLRGVREFYAGRLGRDIDIYATEYGSTTKPNGGLTEQQQAEVNVRRSFNLYAEGVTGFMPHWMGQDEKDPDDKEDWYGHFRKNSEPKPALIAMATAARMIDGSNYVGDLLLGNDVGAMLFETKGEYTLTLWTNDKVIPLDVAAGAKEIKVVDIVGQETTLKSENGSYHFELTGDPIYLVGVSPELAKTATKNPGSDQWVEGIYVRGLRTAHMMKRAAAIDGKVGEDWDGQTRIPMGHSKVAADDASGEGAVAWDKDFLYVAVVIKDDHPGATGEKSTEGDFRKRQHNAYATRPSDGLDVYVGSQPKYQIPEFLHTHDAHLYFSPVPENGKPVAGLVDQGTGEIKDVPGMEYAFSSTPDGWAVEAKIPLAQFKDFPREKGSRVAFEMRVADADPEEPGVRLINPKGADPKFYDDATHWSYLELVD